LPRPAVHQHGRGRADLMTLDQHSDILNAYLARLTLADLRAILASAEYSQAAQLNQPTPEQLHRELEMGQAVRDAIEGMIQHDMDLIDTIVTRTLERTDHREAAHA